MNPVEELLKEKNITYKLQGQDYLVKCFNPEHNDNNPSMRINKDTGIFNCFSCSFKGNLFKHFGILGTNINIRVTKLKKKLRDLVESLVGTPLPDGSTPVNTPFRGISSKTLKRFEAFTTDSVEELVDRIVFPIKDATGKTVVYIARHILSNANPKYIIYPRGVQVPTYPVKLLKGTNSIVLVEGIFDMLNCIDKGLENVVCVFGTQTLKSNTDKKLLFYKAQGVTKVFIMFDGDDAGRIAAKELLPIIEEIGFQVEIINLEDGEDPGELSQENIDSIREYTK
jgi:DNA primase